MLRMDAQRALLDAVVDADALLQRLHGQAPLFLCDGAAHAKTALTSSVRDAVAQLHELQHENAALEASLKTLDAEANILASLVPSTILDGEVHLGTSNPGGEGRDPPWDVCDKVVQEAVCLQLVARARAQLRQLMHSERSAMKKCRDSGTQTPTFSDLNAACADVFGSTTSVLPTPEIKYAVAGSSIVQERLAALLAPASAVDEHVMASLAATTETSLAQAVQCYTLGVACTHDEVVTEGGAAVSQMKRTALIIDHALTTAPEVPLLQFRANITSVPFTNGMPATVVISTKSVTVEVAAPAETVIGTFAMNTLASVLPAPAGSTLRVVNMKDDTTRVGRVAPGVFSQLESTTNERFLEHMSRCATLGFAKPAVWVDATTGAKAAAMVQLELDMKEDKERNTHLQILELFFDDDEDVAAFNSVMMLWHKPDAARALLPNVAPPFALAARHPETQGVFTEPLRTPLATPIKLRVVQPNNLINRMATLQPADMQFCERRHMLPLSFWALKSALLTDRSRPYVTVADVAAHQSNPVADHAYGDAVELLLHLCNQKYVAPHLFLETMPADADDV